MTHSLETIGRVYDLNCIRCGGPRGVDEVPPDLSQTSSIHCGWCGKTDVYFVPPEGKLIIPKVEKLATLVENAKGIPSEQLVATLLFAYYDWEHTPFTAYQHFIGSEKDRRKYFDGTAPSRWMEDIILCNKPGLPMNMVKHIEAMMPPVHGHEFDRLERLRRQVKDWAKEGFGGKQTQREREYLMGVKFTTAELQRAFAICGGKLPYTPMTLVTRQ